MLRDCLEDTRSRILAHADLDGKRLLEIGCGPGRVTRMFTNDARLVVGVEPDFTAVRQGARAVPEASFACGSGMTLPFVDHQFDVVLFTLSLHHHPDSLAALAEARRVAVPGGLVLVLEPTVESEIQRLCKVFEDEDHRLTAVEEALPRCPLKTVDREIFDTHWRFEDFNDVADYTFTYYGHQDDEEKREALRRFLGPKAGDAPLAMTDTLRLTCLQTPE